MIHSFDDLILFLEEEGFVYDGRKYVKNYFKQTVKAYITIEPFQNSEIIDAFYENETIPRKNEDRFVRINIWTTNLVRIDELINYTSNKNIVACLANNFESIILEIEEYLEKHEKEYLFNFRENQQRIAKEEHCIDLIISTTPFAFYSNPNSFCDLWFDLDGIYTCFKFRLDPDENGKFLSTTYKTLQFKI